jgi:hypothetical protein
MEVEDGKITKVQDKWNGNLPDNTLVNVLVFHSRSNLVLPSSERRHYAAHNRGPKGREKRVT